MEVAMSSIIAPRPKRHQATEPANELPSLEPGDRLDQPTFHARYEAVQTDAKFELIGGRVHMASPAKNRHGRHMRLLGRWLDEYTEATPGTDSLINASDILGEHQVQSPTISTTRRTPTRRPA
jgi:hypothetical protein